ncbi:hypothetical protein L7F22_032883 [Adiantum nelumboides]|nr:hypothetical protein [Adiantum nelumboides]
MLSGEDMSSKFLSREQQEEYSSESNVEEEPKKAGCPSGQIEKVFSQLSRVTCAVLDKAVKVLSTTLEKLQHDFKKTHQGPAKQSVEDARSFLEYCCFKALALLTQQNNCLHDAEFRHFTFNFMVAWETPLVTDKDKIECSKKPAASDEAEEDVSLFFSDLMPFLVEVENTVGVEAFVRIAPCISLIADAISVHPQFETLTASTSGRLPFPIYDKYIEALEISLRNMKEKNERSFLKALPMSEEEHVMEIAGTSQMVIQHIGSKALTGRLTLTDHCLYFEPSSLVSYKDAIKYDLSLRIDHRVSTELAGPWGSRMFDKAINYQTTSPEQHVVFEFPELVGSKRRDYWLAIIQEVIDTHKFVRKYNLESAWKMEALARSVLGIVRLQATRDMQLLISSPGALLTFNLAQNMLPGGDHVLEALLSTFENDVSRETNLDTKMDSVCLVLKSFSDTLESFKVWKTEQFHPPLFYAVKHGEPTLLEVAVNEARESSKHLRKAKEKEEEVKFDGIGTNITILKELLRPITAVLSWIRIILSWSKPLQSMIAFVLVAILILRDWLGYIIPFLFAAAGVLIIWLRISGKAMEHREVFVQSSSGGVSLDQVITAQRAVSQMENVLQSINISLLKLLAIIMSVKPKAAVKVAVVFLTLALVLVIAPVKYVVFAMHLGLFAFTLRDKTAENRLVRRLRELWHTIPPVPVRMIESDGNKTQKG